MVRPENPLANRHLPRAPLRRSRGHCATRAGPPVRYRDKPVPRPVRGPFSMPIRGPDCLRFDRTLRWREVDSNPRSPVRGSFRARDHRLGAENDADPDTRHPDIVPCRAGSNLARSLRCRFMPTRSAQHSRERGQWRAEARHRTTRAATRKAACSNMASTIEEPPVDGPGHCATHVTFSVDLVFDSKRQV